MRTRVVPILFTGVILLVMMGLVRMGDAEKLSPWTAPAQATPQVGVPKEALGQFYQEHEVELYTLYYDFDQDGDIDIAYSLHGPIRIIENRTDAARAEQ